MRLGWVAMACWLAVMSACGGGGSGTAPQDGGAVSGENTGSGGEDQTASRPGVWDQMTWNVDHWQ